MERRTDSGGSVEESKARQAIRRTLGRLFGRVGVRTATDAERVMTAAVRSGALASPPPFLPGAAWQPPAPAAKRAPVPAAAVGQWESGLLPQVRLAQKNHALAAPEVAVLPNAAMAVCTKAAPVAWTAAVVALPESFVRLPPSQERDAVRVQSSALLTAPKSRRLEGWAMTLPPVRALRLPRLDTPRIRWGGDAVLRRMPLTRQSRPLGAGQAERRRLAETAHLGADDVTLLGVYPDVPILAVERLVVEDEGRRLKLWLKPETLRGRSGTHRITLLVGRQTATGKMLQAAL